MFARSDFVTLFPKFSRVATVLLNEVSKIICFAFPELFVYRRFEFLNFFPTGKENLILLLCGGNNHVRAWPWRGRTLTKERAIL